MTEEEAKTKWCPCAREIGDPGMSGCNRDYQGTPMSMCIGSACMAWRWMDEVVSTGDDTYKRIYTRGYCGLAGAPQ